MAAQFEVYEDKGGKYRWRLKAANGQTVASSGESFDSKSNAREAAESVKRTAAEAEIREASGLSPRPGRAAQHVPIPEGGHHATQEV
jgi:uncharacterized protein YegP (UPF0339 family)